MSIIQKMLIIDEKLELKPYRDSVNKLTIGIGRNLDDVGISEDEAMYMLRNDLARVEKELSNFNWFTNLDDVRKDVLRNMCFNLGISKLLEFTYFLSALESSNYSNAASEMLNSDWAREVHGRANRLAKIMLDGTYGNVYE